MNRLVSLHFVVFTLVAHSSLLAQEFSLRPEAEIRWRESIPEALDQGRESGRLVLIFVTADYCGYCRKMERETWSDPQVVRRIEDGFVALKLDAEQHNETVAKLAVRGLPTTIVYDGRGKHLKTVSGYSRPEAIAELLDSLRSGVKATAVAAEAPR
jgi:thiol:disulfide interchange protein